MILYYSVREFKDVVFEDVVFGNDSLVTLLYTVVYCNIYANYIIIKHHILKHHILELPNYSVVYHSILCYRI